MEPGIAPVLAGQILAEHSEEGLQVRVEILSTKPNWVADIVPDDERHPPRR